MLDKPFEILAQTGVLGAIVCVLLFALGRLFSIYKTSQDQRVAELIAFKASIDANTQALRELTNAEWQRFERSERTERGRR